jgi:hypothetical protein
MLRTERKPSATGQVQVPELSSLDSPWIDGLFDGASYRFVVPDTLSS